MGKPTGKKKGPVASKSGLGKASDRASKAFDEDTAVFINMSQELKEEGNKLFQKHDHEGAMLKYEKALKLLPRNHIDVAYLRSNMAACYMQMGLGEFPRAINECNLALEVAPKYSKALLKRARCYDALNRLDLALRDVNIVLSIEPNNLTALEIADKLKKTIEDKQIVLPPECVEPPPPARRSSRSPAPRSSRSPAPRSSRSPAPRSSPSPAPRSSPSPAPRSSPSPAPLSSPSPAPRSSLSSRSAKDKMKKKKNSKFEKKKKAEEVEVEKVEEPADRKAEDKVVVEEKLSVREEKIVTKSVKLILGEDIRWAQLPVDCSVRIVRNVVLDRFPGLEGVLIKYKDQEGDLVTITTTDELRLAEASSDPQGFLRLYLSEVSPEREPFYEGSNEVEVQSCTSKPSTIENGNVEKSPQQNEGQTCVEDWIIQFARVFKNHVGFDCDSYLDIHEVGMKLYSEAMEDTVTRQDAQELFDIAATKFQEMAALAMFNWGNVHMSKARRQVCIKEDGSKESALAQIKSAYEWAKREYVKAGMRYEEALKIKPDFYEGLIALGQQQFEQAKLSWYYFVGIGTGLESGESAQVLELYNKAEDSMERGVQMWEEMEEQRLNGLSKSEKDRAELQKLGLDGLLKDLSAEEAAEQVAKMKSHIHLLWGTLLYERSVVEFKLSLPTWEECLEVAVEKFELAGASPTDIAVMVKNHCSNETALEDFEVDEIVQAWNEMYDADRWLSGVSSFRLEPLFRRRAPKLHSMLQSFCP